ncbi:MAG: ATP-dependent DNA helicase RecG [Gaiellales bacterium]|nr:MAG: ATP-dependent DNA helicase RecG [Gaiellales bacterium]
MQEGKVMTQARCLRHFARSSLLTPADLPRTSKSTFNPPALGDPLTVLKGVGPALAREAGRLGLATLADLLSHFPRRHEDFSSSREIGQLRLGEEATVAATVERVTLQRTRRPNLRVVKATLRDDTGILEAVWFNQDYLADQLAPGDRLLVRGRYEGKGGNFRIISHELLGDSAGLHTTGLVPVYPTTEKISVKRLRGWLDQVRPLFSRLADPLPSGLLLELGLPRRADAMLAMHFPRSAAEYALARRRLVFEELFLMQLALLAYRRHYERERRSVALGPAGELSRRFRETLPFSLTADQEAVAAGIGTDLEGDRPMQRLLQGDVGSGKTVVAVLTLLRAVESGRQGALMAPTEVLAEQHFLNLKRMLAGTGVKVAFLSSRLGAKEREGALAAMESGEADIAVGTHALIQEDVVFAELAVVVVDEQHRFGVQQREDLADKATRDGITPHTLHMTATPIPRTLALTLYGDLEVSTIRQMPPGRKPVRTWHVPEAKRAGAYGFIREQLDAGRQCYVVCPLIEESEKLEARAVEAEAARLREGEFREYRVDVLHGQMPAQQKQEAMRRFADGETQVLVTTTVIEVGVDVPNATVMMVEEADRFGLAQLHQLRGRVGRGEHESFCLLFADPGSEAAVRRLGAMASTADGFALADIDLEIRGEGQLFGLRQSGFPDLKLARLTRDQDALKLARREAGKLLAADPDLARLEDTLLREEIARRFGDTVEWLRRI